MLTFCDSAVVRDVELTAAAMEAIGDYYAELRSESATGALPVTVRTWMVGHMRRGSCRRRGCPTRSYALDRVEIGSNAYACPPAHPTCRYLSYVMPPHGRQHFSNSTT